MDVKKLRNDAELIARNTPNYTVAWRVSTALLRILDAFEAMERDYVAALYYSQRYDVWMLSGQKMDGKAASPLEALLAAAQTLEDKTDG
jgi:hypothetical protein